MPYVNLENRQELQDLENEIIKAEILQPGNLNYVITCLIRTYLYNAGVSYTSLNDVIGVLECAKLEAYARLARPYEDAKLEQNGEVYGDLI